MMATASAPIAAELSNGEILALLRSKIDDALKRKRLRSDVRVVLEVQQLFVIYLANDHPRVVTMWRWFQPTAWAALILAATFLGLLGTGHLDINIR